VFWPSKLLERLNPLHHSSPNGESDIHQEVYALVPIHCLKSYFPGYTQEAPSPTAPNTFISPDLKMSIGGSAGGGGDHNIMTFVTITMEQMKAILSGSLAGHEPSPSVSSTVLLPDFGACPSVQIRILVQEHMRHYHNRFRKKSRLSSTIIVPRFGSIYPVPLYGKSKTDFMINDLLITALTSSAPSGERGIGGKRELPLERFSSVVSCGPISFIEGIATIHLSDLGVPFQRFLNKADWAHATTFENLSRGYL
jgi:hypothetical protein